MKLVKKGRVFQFLSSNSERTLDQRAAAIEVVIPITGMSNCILENIVGYTESFQEGFILEKDVGINIWLKVLC